VSSAGGTSPGDVFGRWKTRLGFIAAIMGMAVGTGNIWRFPRMAAAYGGCSFIIPWVISLVLIAVPLFIAEGVIGIATRHGTIGGFTKWIGPRYAWMGLWMMWVNYAITFYYTVVAGWCLRYAVYALQGAFATYKPGLGQELWDSFVSDPVQTIVFTAAVWVLAYIILVYGTRGIETACKIIMPLLAILLVVLIGRALSLPGAGKGLEYYWIPHADRLANAETWLQGFTQTLWSTGAGWGLYLTYSILFAEKEGKGAKPEINLNAFTTGFGNHSYSLLAGLAVIPAVAALAPLVGVTPEEVYASGNVGLSFIWLAEMFPKLPLSTLWAFIFYLGLTIAALSSLICQVMVVAVNLQEYLGWSRSRVVLLTVLLGFIAGIPSALSVDFLNNQDWVWGLGLLLTSIFTFIAISKKAEESLNFANSISDIKIGRWWIYIIKYVAPAIVIVVLGWWIASGIIAHPADWWNPLIADSIGTVLIQWAVVLAIFVALNNRLARRFTQVS